MGLIADNLPQFDDGGFLRTVTDGLEGSVTAVRDRALTVRAAWSGLEGAYDAPEVGQLLPAMDTPAEAATELTADALKVGAALRTYAGKLDELQARRDQLAADIRSFEVFRQHAEAETNWWEDALGIGEVDLLHREEDLHERAAQLAADADQAQLECANAIFQLLGAETYEAADRTTLEDHTKFGLSFEGYLARGEAGDNEWGTPDAWSPAEGLSLTTAVLQFGRGAWRSVTSTVDMGAAVLGLGAPGEPTAVRSQLFQAGPDLVTFLAPVPVLAEQKVAAGERLLDRGWQFVGGNTWGTTPFSTAGAVALDVAGLFTGVGAVKSAARAGLAAAKAGIMRTVPPMVSSSVGHLISATRVRSKRMLSDALRRAEISEEAAQRQWRRAKTFNERTGLPRDVLGSSPPPALPQLEQGQMPVESVRRSHVLRPIPRVRVAAAH